MKNKKDNNAPLINTLFDSLKALSLIAILVFLLWIISLLLNKIGIAIDTKTEIVLPIVSIISAFGIALFIYYSNKKDKDEEEIKKQKDLLIVLQEELNFLFGNLKAYKESFSKPNHYPLYELWKIDTSLYFSNLDHKIKDKKTLKLKKDLMKIKDKIILINNFKIEMKELGLRGNEDLIKTLKPVEIIRKQVIEIIDKELMPLVDNSKEEINKLISF